MRPIALLLSAAAMLAPTIASASETITYGYDAKGRLIQVSHVGSANNGLVATYAYDAADNRTGVSTSGATARLVVVPLNGLTVIPTR